MADIWVVNASPLISLDQIGCVYLLARLAREVIIPRGVIEEVGRGRTPLEPARLGVHSAVAVIAVHPQVAAWDLGVGESEVLSWAMAAPGAVAILDDRAARLCAATLGVRTRGTLGVVLDAKKAGFVDAAAPLIEKLRAAGLYLSEALVKDALKIVGEIE